MTDHEIVCPKCGTAMREGFVPDHAQGGYVQTTWYEGPVEKSFWAGLRSLARATFRFGLTAAPSAATWNPTRPEIPTVLARFQPRTARVADLRI